MGGTPDVIDGTGVDQSALGGSDITKQPVGADTSAIGGTPNILDQRSGMPEIDLSPAAESPTEPVTPEQPSATAATDPSQRVADFLNGLGGKPLNKDASPETAKAEEIAAPQVPQVFDTPTAPTELSSEGVGSAAPTKEVLEQEAKEQVSSPTPDAINKKELEVSQAYSRLIDEIEEDARSNPGAIYFAEFGSKDDGQGNEMAKDQRFLVFKCNPNDETVMILTRDGPIKLTLNRDQFDNLNTLHDSQVLRSNMVDKKGGYIKDNGAPKFLFGNSVSNPQRFTVDMDSENVSGATPEEFLSVVKQNRETAMNGIEQERNQQAQRLNDASTILSGFRALTSPNPSAA